ncbi:MAG: helix-turn-helix domain-containing protein [Proteobacteria bacterium]|nr:helix-turn-helix domain-containing protein [Pseudomonadota bacterium]
MSFGDKLRAIRTQHKLSLEKLGQEIDVTKATIWQWENIITDAENIKTKNMDALCKFFNVSKAYFLDTSFIRETTVQYQVKDVIEFDDMLSKSIKYVLDNARHLNNNDKTIASRLLYNRVKNQKLILKSDLVAVLQLLE